MTVSQGSERREAIGTAAAAKRFEAATFFYRECVCCGRQLQIRVDYLGKPVCCQHCGCRFRATDPGLEKASMPESEPILSRADRLLATLKPNTDGVGLPRAPQNSDQSMNAGRLEDERLRLRVGAFLQRREIQGLEDVEIEVNKGVVTLSGHVRSNRTRWLLTTTCRRVAGVLYVIDKLEVDQSKTGALRILNSERYA